jgi:uncharacterized membrane protein
LRGLTSVAFLFAAGLSFHVATLRDLPAHLASPDAVRSRIRRAGMLIALGYLLHAPVPALTGASAAPSGLLEEAVVVDILQCIGVSVLVLELVTLGLRNVRGVRAVCAVAALAVLGLASLTLGQEASGSLRPLLNYVSSRGGSPFPLLPWAAHVLLGVALGPWLLRPGGRAVRFAGSAAALLGLGVLASVIGLEPAGAQVQRLGFVLLVCAGLSLLEHLRWPTWLLAIAGETLFIYVLHVLVVYARGIGLQSLFPDGLSLGPALGVTLLVLALSFGLAAPFRELSDRLARRTATG